MVPCDLLGGGAVSDGRTSGGDRLPSVNDKLRGITNLNSLILRNDLNPRQAPSRRTEQPTDLVEVSRNANSDLFTAPGNSSSFAAAAPLRLSHLNGDDGKPIVFLQQKHEKVNLGLNSERSILVAASANVKVRKQLQQDFSSGAPVNARLKERGETSPVPNAT